MPKDQRVDIDNGKLWVESMHRTLEPARPAPQGGVSFQRLTIWKASADPDYAVKQARMEHLYAIANREVIPEPGEPEVIFCVDEFGPLNLQPHTGRQWVLEALSRAMAKEMWIRDGRKAVISRLPGQAGVSGHLVAHVWSWRTWTPPVNLHQARRHEIQAVEEVHDFCFAA